LVVIFGLVTTLSLWAQQEAPPKPITGKVVSISDGDTIKVLLDQTQHKIRLDHIDAPESHQDFGTKAKHVLGDKIHGREVKVVWKARDKYGRILGVVYLDERNINLEMVREGFAWHFVKYSKDVEYAKAEKEAREKKLGLWAMPNPIPPWDFRKGKGIEDPNAEETDPAKFTVYVASGGKKYHTATCRSVAKSKIPILLGEACGKYEPCGICKPPTLKAPAKNGGD